ncbi:hypothetical protein [Vibrio sp. CAU 1672]|uniref:hypothetical protein n=1 Tax=Vibrio sp. CAU 1672 TaxID=3032594 RepID=UPI0023DB192D|nr:hypothetical protein [Vibrio sp. CAU 1672]MDF2154052.1 hypothetical protein [Vibrio sp. CAU 1672]
MNKRLWPIAILSVGLLAAYWLLGDRSMASATGSSPTANRAAPPASAHGEPGAVIELKQTLMTADELKISPFPDGTNVAEPIANKLTEQAQEPLLSSQANHSHLLQTAAETTKPQDDTTLNGKPIINLAVEQQLQTLLYAWELTQNTPVNYSLNVDQLFEDPDGDLLTTRIWLESDNGLTVLNQGQIVVRGAPERIDTTSYVVVAARDDYHGDQEQAWVTTRFELPTINEAHHDTEHALIGGTIYRLETTTLLGGQKYAYEVVYCEAFQFSNNEVFYAAANNQRTCPNDTQLEKIGEYQISDKSVIIAANGTRQIWTTKKVYPSQVQKDTENLFITVYAGKRFESYTMQKSKPAMEQRLNVHTGEYEYQMTMFDYLFPMPGKGYVLGVAGNYIFDRSVQADNQMDVMDSDLNMKSPNQDLYCNDFQSFWYSSVVAGPGEFTDIISSSVDPFDSSVPLHCGEWYDPNWQRTYTFYNLEYPTHETFLEGEAYSYILRPLPQFADRVEELKLNMIYHRPKGSRIKKIKKI